MAQHMTAECAQCEGTGLEPVFQHVSFPVYAPDQQTVKIEPFDFARWPWRWEEEEVCHRLYRSHRICVCEAGRLRLAAEQEQAAREARRGKRQGGWQ